MEPLIGLRITDDGPLQPGQTLRWEYQVKGLEAEQILAIETSVLWYTEGKGEEDLAVHFFQRRTASEEADGDLRRLHSCETTLPLTPLSYSGVIVKVRWCVRLRVFLASGEQRRRELLFQLAPAKVKVKPA